MSTSTLEARSAKKTIKPATKESFVKHSAVYGLGTLATQAISILLLPLYTQVLPVGDFAALTLIKKIGDVMHRCLMVGGIRQATLNFWGTGDEKTRATIAATVSFFVYASWVVAAALLLVLAQPLSSFLGFGNTPYVLPIGVIAFLFSASTFMPLALMQARLESMQFVVASLAIALLQCIVAIATVAFLGWGIWGVIAAMTVAYVGVGVPLTIRELAKSQTAMPNWQQLRELIRFSLPFIPTGLFFFVLMGGDQIFLARLADESVVKEVVAVYGLGHRLAMVVSLVVIMPLTQVWSAWMYTAYKEKNAGELMGKAITRILLVYITATIGLALLKTELLTFLAKEEYLGAAHVIVPVAVANFFMIFANLMDAALWVTRRTDRKPYIAAASATLMAALYFVLIPKFGAVGSAEMGAAYATLLGLIGHACFTYFATRNVFRIRFEFGRLLIAGIIATGCCIVGNHWGDGFLLVPYKLGVFASWIGIIWLCGLLSVEEKILVRQQLADVVGRFARR